MVEKRDRDDSGRPERAQAWQRVKPLSPLSSDPDGNEGAATFEGEEEYFADRGQRVFDASILREPLHLIPTRTPVILSAKASASEAMRAMQAEHRGCVLVTEDGTARSRLLGIFTERDVLVRIIDRGRNPATLALTDVMTPEPEALPAGARVAWVLNVMSTGGFRHVPVVDGAGHPSGVVSVRDVVQFLVDAFPSEILNLPPDFATSSYSTREGA